MDYVTMELEGDLNLYYKIRGIEVPFNCFKYYFSMEMNSLNIIKI